MKCSGFINELVGACNQFGEWQVCIQAFKICSELCHCLASEGAVGKFKAGDEGGSVGEKPRLIGGEAGQVAGGLAPQLGSGILDASEKAC